MIMKVDRILLAASLLLSIMIPVSCVKDDSRDGSEGRTISLAVSVPATMVKSSPVPGVGNENKVNSVYYFLFKEGVENEQPVLKGYFSNTGINGSAKSFDIPVSTSDVLTNLYPVGKQNCRAFIVANPPSAIVSTLEAGTTLNGLRSLTLDASFDDASLPESLVMVYDGLVPLTSRSAKTVATVDAKMWRLADKFTFKVNITSSYTDDKGDVWEPVPGSLNVVFANGLNKTNLSGDYELLSSVRGRISDSDYFESVPIYFDMEATDEFVRVGRRAAFSYPMKWDFTDQYEPYVLFELRWKKQGTSGSGTPFFYKMMLSFKETEPNYWFNIIANLDILGSLERHAPYEMYPNAVYKVLGWKDAYESVGGTGGNVDANIKDAQYLVVNQTEYIIHDQDKLSIPFSSSHECKVTVTAKKLNPQTGSYDVDVANPASYFSFNGNVLELNHPLHNEIDANLDVAPYKFNVRISHKTDDDYYEDLVIYQYPAIYIDIEPNSAGNTNKGWVFVNTKNNAFYTNEGALFFLLRRDNDAQYGGVQGTNSSNPSTSMTVITVGRLSENSGFILGDPRKTVATDLSSWTSELKNAKVVYDKGIERKMKYYYETDSQKKDYIAPKLRSTSGHARLTSGSALGLTTNPLDYTTAFRRCATYQEDGYPAGRWRLPSAAEIRFIANLSNKGKIESMFTNGQIYWCGNGYVQVPSNTSDPIPDVVSNTSGEHYVRCVYDEWYWNQIDKAYNDGVVKTSNDGSRDVTPNTPYWGDIDRSNFRYD